MKKTDLYWSQLLEKLRRGVITDLERFELEKHALDDPFLFDAIEGYTLYDDAQNDVGDQGSKATGRLFTLPRMAAAASVIFLVSMIWLMKGDQHDQLESDQSIAMVLDQDDKKDVLDPKPAADEVPARAVEESEFAEVKEEERPSTMKKKESPKSLPKNTKPVATKQNVPVQTEVIESANDDMDVAVDAGRSTVPVNEDELAFDTDDTDGIVSADPDVMEVSTSKKRLETKSNLLLAAEPEIGRKDFDAYALDLIKQRGLQQNPTQTITIEFTVMPDGTLSDFTHIVDGENTCPKCGALAMAIMQRSGLWKTKSDLVQGRSRYIFKF